MAVKHEHIQINVQLLWCYVILREVVGGGSAHVASCNLQVAQKQQNTKTNLTVPNI